MKNQDKYSQNGEKGDFNLTEKKTIFVKNADRKKKETNVQNNFKTTEH